jgi:osomolarity two-component system sensor histidine kinase SLN1
MKIRIAIREQLAALVTFAVLVALAVVSIPVWIYVNNFVVGVETQSLSLTASLKAARISSEINLVQTTCQTISTRLLLQQDFQNFYASNFSGSDPFNDAESDLLSALNSGGYSGLFQARLFSRNSTGNSHGLLNVTGSGIGDDVVNIELPYLTPDGQRANLSLNEEWGYPPSEHHPTFSPGCP